MVTVTYTCPRCDSVVELERGPYLADKCVTPGQLEEWEYVSAYEFDGPETADEEDPYMAAGDGVELVCGAMETVGDGCGEPFYLSFVKFAQGSEIDPAVGLGDSVSFGFGGR